MNRTRIQVVALALVVLFTLIPNTALAARSCQVEPASTPAARAELWTEALERFTAERPGLTAEQTQFISDALKLGNEIGAVPHDERAQAVFARKAMRIMERSRELFSNNDLGALFTDMGETQIWLAAVAAVPAYCNCVGIGPCQMPNGGPIGDCKAGCQTWDDTNGTRWDGICTPKAAPADEAQ